MFVLRKENLVFFARVCIFDRKEDFAQSDSTPTHHHSHPAEYRDETLIYHQVGLKMFPSRIEACLTVRMVKTVGNRTGDRKRIRRENGTKPKKKKKRRFHVTKKRKTKKEKRKQQKGNLSSLFQKKMRRRRMGELSREERSRGKRTTRHQKSRKNST